MDAQQPTPKGVQPSDQDNCEVVKGSFELESGTCGESELVCELPHSKEYVCLKRRTVPRMTFPPKDGHPARNAHPNNDGNISQGTQDVGGNPTTQTPTFLHLLFFHLLFFPQLNLITVGCIIAISLLCFNANLVGADQTCRRVLTANDVDDSDSNLLHFSGGQYKEIEEGAFGNSEAAELLDLSYNCLSYLSQDIFNNMTDVVSINMAGNDFSRYPSAFRKSEILSNLEHLSFMGNFLHYLGMDYFIGKEKLAILNFASNGIESIHNQALDPLSALKSLNLSENHLTSLSFLNVTKLKNLGHIYVTNNFLKYLNIKYFSNFPNITRISITDDKMTLERNDREDPMVFWIDGNSETLSCEDNKHDIERAKVHIKYNFTCQNSNNTSQVLEGTMLPKNSPTTETSQVLEGSMLPQNSPITETSQALEGSMLPTNSPTTETSQALEGSMLPTNSPTTETSQALRRSRLPQNTPTAVTSRVFEGSSLPQKSPTMVMSSVTYSSTPFPLPNAKHPWIWGLSISLVVAIIIIIACLVLVQHYKREAKQVRRMRVSSNSNGTNGVQSSQSIQLMPTV